MKELSQAERWEIALRHRDSMKLQNQIGFSDVDTQTPDIDFYQDGEFYTNSSIIHMGAFSNVFGRVYDETELVSQWDFARGHEEQHCRSTAFRPYGLGIQRGCHAILDYIAKETKAKIRLVKDSDYEYFANTMLPKMGIYISFRMMNDIVGGIFNSLEDGRIERIRSSRFPGFEALRIKYRGMFWEAGEPNFKPYEEIKDNPAVKLMIICNQILTLATCQLYEKGFVQTYAGTPLIKEVEDLMPEIGAGIIAGKTRDMAEQGVRICRKLAPYIYESCKMAQSDIEAKKALEKLLADMIKSMVDSMPDTGLDEKDEDTDEGSAASTFPVSDLVITLDDETYDKLMKNSKKSENDGDGIMIRREHPKEDEGKESQDEPQRNSADNGQTNKSDGSSSNNSSSDNNTSGNDGNGESSSEQSGQQAASDAGKAGSTGENQNGDSANADEDENAGQGNSSSGEEASTDNKESQDGSGAGSAKDENTGESYSDSAGTDSNSGNNDESGSSSQMNPSKNGENQKATKKSPKEMKSLSKNEKVSAEEAIQKAMKEAAAQTAHDSEEKIETVNRANATQVKAAKSGTTKESPDNSAPIKPSEMKDICNFIEKKREYQITDNLPPVLAKRGNALHKKNERYFKGLSTPNISYLDSGSIDPSRIFGLSFGDTDIFRKNGKDKRFDGCAYILIDNSGSMSGAKRREACKAAAVIEEGFKGLVPIKIVAFDEWGTVVHEIIKNWNESYQKNCCWNFCQHGRTGSGNEDNYDIQIATRELLARPESKKLMVVLSDGTPGDTRATKGAIEAARRKGIQVSGIYFEEGCIGRDANDFKDMYQKDYICCEASQIDQNLIKIFQKFSRS